MSSIRSEAERHSTFTDDMSIRSGGMSDFHHDDMSARSHGYNFDIDRHSPDMLAFSDSESEPEGAEEYYPDHTYELQLNRSDDRHGGPSTPFDNFAEADSHLATQSTIDGDNDDINVNQSLSAVQQTFAGLSIDNQPARSTGSISTSTSTSHMYSDPMDATTSRRARTILLDLISSILLADQDLTSPATSVSLLTDAQHSARTSGIPFSYLLQQPLTAIGDVTPLSFEVMRCNYEESPELMNFLIDNISADRQSLEWMVRKACLRRENGGNTLLQHLLKRIALKEIKDHSTFTEDTIPEDMSQGLMDYDIVPTEFENDEGLGDGFTVLLSIWDFAKTLERFKLSANRKRHTIRSKNPPRYSVDDMGYLATDEPYVPMQFIVYERAWQLEIGANSLKLTLLDGESADVDVRVAVIAPALTNSNVAEGSSATTTNAQGASTPNPFEFLFPRGTIHPISHSGQHTLMIKHCFTEVPVSSPSELRYSGKNTAPYMPRGFDDAVLLNDSDELLLQLTVKLESLPSPMSSSSPVHASPQPMMRTVENEWEMLQANQPGASQAGPSRARSGQQYGTEWANIAPEEASMNEDAGWVNASWSGRDVDL